MAETADYETVYRMLFEGIMDAITEIEKKNYGYARLTLIKARRSAVVIFLESGDTDNTVLRILRRPEEETLKN